LKNYQKVKGYFNLLEIMELALVGRVSLAVFTIFSSLEIIMMMRAISSFILHTLMMKI